jgi:hypothetical protein
MLGGTPCRRATRGFPKLFMGETFAVRFSVAEDCSALCSALAEEQLPHEFGRYNVQELDPQALDLSRPTARCLS